MNLIKIFRLTFACAYPYIIPKTIFTRKKPEKQIFIVLSLNSIISLKCTLPA